MWLTDGQTDRQTDGRTDERHTIIRPKFYFGRIKINQLAYRNKVMSIKHVYCNSVSFKVACLCKIKPKIFIIQHCAVTTYY